MSEKKLRKKKRPKVSQTLSDWLFACCIAILNCGMVQIKYKDFRKSKIRKERKLLGEVDVTGKDDCNVIYIDRYRGDAAEILHHELMHGLFSFSTFYDNEEVMPEECVHGISDAQWELLTDVQKALLRTYLPSGRRRHPAPKSKKVIPRWRCN